MALKYLMDENVDPAYPTQIRRKRFDLVIRVIGELGTPAKSTLVLCQIHFDGYWEIYLPVFYKLCPQNDTLSP